MPVLKVCPGCRESLPVGEFGRDKQKGDGLTSRCKPCRRAEYAVYAQTEAGRANGRARVARWVKAHPEKAKAACVAWRAKNPGYSAEYNRLWREANPGVNAAYHQANRDKTMERVNRRRKRLKSVSIDDVDLAQLWLEGGGSCGICGSPINPDVKHPDPLSKSVDHIVPLSKGGTHEQANLQWSHLVCNIRKGATVPDYPHGPRSALIEGSGSHHSPIP